MVNFIFRCSYGYKQDPVYKYVYISVKAELPGDAGNMLPPEFRTLLVFEAGETYSELIFFNDNLLEVVIIKGLF